MALTLQRLLDRRAGDPDLKSRIRSSGAKSRLLRALSPCAAVHLLGVEYAIKAGKRWSSCRGGETVIQGDWKRLQPLVDYAEGRTTVRLICDDGPAKVRLLLSCAEPPSQSSCIGMRRRIAAPPGC